MNDISKEDLKILNKVWLDIDSGKKNVDIPMREKMYIRGNTNEPISKCSNCGKIIPKNNGRQIVYFCSSKCRKERRHYKPAKFEVVR